jgi:hypothetical protein
LIPANIPTFLLRNNSILAFTFFTVLSIMITYLGEKLITIGLQVVLLCLKGPNSDNNKIDGSMMLL